jgi:hypothetical protein
MQERPQLPSRRQPSVKKETAGSGQFHDLREAATPLIGGSVESNNAETATKEVSFQGTAEVVETELKEEVIEQYDTVIPSNESLELESEETIFEETQFQETAEIVEAQPKEEVAEPHDVVPSGIELENDETIVEEIQFQETAEVVEPEHQDKVMDLSNSESNAEVQEKELAIPPIVQVREVKSRKRRSRKDRSNGHKNENAHEGQGSTSIYNETNFPKNGKDHPLTDQEANAPAEQTTVPSDRTEE